VSLIKNYIKLRELTELPTGSIYLYYFINLDTLLELMNKDFIIIKKNLPICFSKLYDLPQTQYSWIRSYPIRISLYSETLFNKYPTLLQKESKVEYSGKRVDISESIVQIDVIRDLNLHIPEQNFLVTYKDKFTYAYKKLINSDYYRVFVVDSFNPILED
jgi:hypothetical protein